MQQAQGHTWAYPPQWMQEQVRPVQPTTCLINMDAFSDASDSEDERPATQQCKAAPAAPALSSDKELKVPSYSPAQTPTSAAEPAAEPLPIAISCGEPSTASGPSPRSSITTEQRLEDDAEGSDAGSGTTEPDAELEEAAQAAPPVEPEAKPAAPSPAGPPKRSCSVEEPEAEESPEAVVATPQACKPPRAQPYAGRGPRGPAAEQPVLRPSANSWASRQRHAAEDDDARIVRSVKSILNKLTVEKFPQLYEQLLACGVSTPTQVKQLIQEVFEKATTQHHFIDLYADLCALLQDHFAKHPVSEDAEHGFKRLLLCECQSSFERHLAPPEDIKDIADFDERSSAEHRYKTKMLGNIRFVGALVTRKMLATKVMLAICHELITEYTPETLESVAALLTVVGPTFDRAEWVGRPALSCVFKEIEAIARKPECDPRARCLLQDLLDLRAGGWKDRRPKRIEGPMKLEQVAQRAAEEDTGAWWAQSAKAKPWTPTQAGVRKPMWQARPFDRKEFREILSGLRGALDEAGAAERLARMPPPPVAQQAADFAYILGQVSREVDAEVRQVGYGLAAKLFFKGLTSTGENWDKRALAQGVIDFAGHAANLRADVPALPEIVGQELVATLKPLKVGGLLPQDSIDRLLATA